MVVEILLIILIFEIAILIWRHWDRPIPYVPFPTATNATPVSLPLAAKPEDIAPAPPGEAHCLDAQCAMVELLHRPSDHGHWQHHSWRPAGHKDISEALATPNMAVRDVSGIVEGQQ